MTPSQNHTVACIRQPAATSVAPSTASMTHLGNMVRYDVAEWISQLLDQRIEPDELVS